MKLIGIAGTNGSGKDTVGRLLAEKHGFMNVSVSDLLRDECRKRELPVSRENLRAISAEWRRGGGLGVLVDKAVELFRQHEGDYEGLAVGSLRNPGEIDTVHGNGGLALWVDADSRIRYDRIQASHRGRDDEDNKTYEQFLAEEEAEMQHSGDEATLNMAGVKALCDTTVLNEGDQRQLEAYIKDALASL
jgi:dephospho-CoA kinase